MKKLLSILIALLSLCTSASYAQQGRIAFCQMDIVDITSFGHDTIVAVGGYLLNPVSGWPNKSGFIMRSTDGGSTWDIQYRENSQAQLHKLCALSESKGFAVSDSGLLYSTIDAGATWKKEVLPYNYHYYDIEFTDSLTGYITGSQEKYLKTTNGGQTWSLGSVGGSYNGLYDIEWVNDTTAFLCGEKSYKTINGGANWTTSSSGMIGFRIRQHWTSLLNGWQTTGASTLYTTDGGITFTQNSTFGITDYHAFSNTHLIGIQDSTISETNDGGFTWNVISHLPAGFQGKSIYFTDALTGYVGGNNAILKTIDGGINWTYTGYHPEIGNTYVFPIDSNVIYACAYSSMNYTINGGLLWKTRTINIPGGITKMYFFDAANGLLAGGNGIYSTSDSGATWNMISGKILSDIAAFSPTHIMGYENNIFVYSIDGGTTWTSAATQTTNFKIEILNANLGFAMVGNDLFRTTDGGDTWINMVTQGILISHWDMADQNTGIAEEPVNGKIYYTTDGGHTWNLRTNSFQINDLAMLSPSELYVASTSQIFSSDTALTFTDIGSRIDPTFYRIARIPTGGILFYSSSAMVLNPQLGYPQCKVNASFNQAYADMFETDLMNISNQSTFASQYQWTADGIPVSTNNNYQYLGSTTGTHSVCLDANDGPTCTDQTCSTIEVYPLASQWLYRTPNYNSISQHRATFVIGDYAYECTGEFMSSGHNLTAKIDLRNLTTQSAANLPAAARHSAIGFAINGKGYVGLGFGNGNTYLSDLWEYDPANDSWTQKTSYPGNGNKGASVFVINNKAYVINGSSFNGSAITYYNECWEYDPINNTWAARSAFPGAGRSYTLASAAHGYAICGGGNCAAYFNDYYKYDAAADQWTAINPIPTIPYRTNGLAFTHDNTVYFTGGHFPINNKTTVWGYNINSGNWDSLSATIPTTLIDAMRFSHGDSILISSPYYSGTSHNDLYYLRFSPDTTTTGISSSQIKEQGLMVSPNPSTGDFKISAKSGEQLQRIEIYNLDGRRTKNILLNNENSIQVQIPESGIYLIKSQSNKRTYINRVTVIK